VVVEAADHLLPGQLPLEEEEVDAGCAQGGQFLGAPEDGRVTGEDDPAGAAQECEPGGVGLGARGIVRPEEFGEVRGPGASRSDVLGGARCSPAPAGDG
jgi:hypothetical protein